MARHDLIERHFKDIFIMLQYPATFLIIAVVSGFMGFGSIAGLVAVIAQILFFIFLGLFILSFVLSGPSPRD